jgi:hypothetical protein
MVCVYVIHQGYRSTWSKGTACFVALLYVISVAIVIVGILMLLVTRMHYTADIVVGIYVSVFLCTWCQLYFSKRRVLESKRRDGWMYWFEQDRFI